MARPTIDLAGATVGRWTVLRPAEQTAIGGRMLWCCRCVCGAECVRAAALLLRTLRGHTDGTSKCRACASRESSIHSITHSARSYGQRAGGAIIKARANRVDAQFPGLSRNRRYSLKSEFGLTPANYLAIYHRQGGMCANKGCGTSLPEWVAPVDHCHRTGAVRGLLCNPCNTALGFAGESAERLKGLAEYSENWRLASGF